MRFGNSDVTRYFHFLLYCLSVFFEFSIMSIHYFCNKVHGKEDQGNQEELPFWVEAARKCIPHLCCRLADQGSRREFLELIPEILGQAEHSEAGEVIWELHVVDGRTLEAL